MAKCGICGREFGAITWKHLKYKHGITMDEYREMGHRCGNEKDCPICGEMFVPDRREQQTCGMECGAILRGRKMQGENHPRYGKSFSHTEEAKRKMSENSARYWQSKKRPGLGEKIAAKLKGRPNLALKGRKFPGRTNAGSFETGHQPWNKGLTGVLTGSDNPNWQGGKTSEGHKIRRSEQYIEWRTTVFERDDYTCQICDQIGRKLVAHHIGLFSEFPDKRFDVDNGVTLCRSCHSSLHNDPNHPLRENLIEVPDRC